MSSPARKMFMGVRLRRLREERSLTQLALAKALDISPSYLNQLENNQRPLTIGVLMKLSGAFGLDLQHFAEDDEARLLGGLREALTDAPGGDGVSLAELRELALNMPHLAKAFTALHQRYRGALDQAHAAALRLGDDRGDVMTPPTAYEEVRDFFYARRNHIADLDAAAEVLAEEAALGSGRTAVLLIERLAARHRIEVIVDPSSGLGARTFDPDRRRLTLAGRLTAGQQAFQLATQIAFLEQGETLDRELAGAGLSLESHALARIGLANYFAGAVVLPYGRFLRAAEAARYDIEALSVAFGVGFETICHRLSTLQRPGAAGVPFILVRTDRAGNISKRQSATDFHFSRYGGTCPLWNVYEAFAQPNRISVQLAEMPDGRRYLWVARTVRRGGGAYGATDKLFAVGLGCELRHADRLVYVKGLERAEASAFTPIGLGCKVCDRKSCVQRAFPPLGRRLAIGEDRSRDAPYWFVA